MQTITVQQAEADFSQVLARAQAGEDVIISKAGKPVAKLVAYKEQKQPRVPGLWKGKIVVPDNFDDEDEEINEMFYGSK